MIYSLLPESITGSLVIILISCFAYYVYHQRKSNVFHRLGIPGPERLPIFGELFNMIRRGVYKNDLHLVHKYGPIVGIYEGVTPMILMSDPEYLRMVLIKDSQLFINRRTIENLTGPFEYGLTVLKDDAWKNVRSIVSPTFSSSKLKAMFCLMNEISDRFNERLLEYADKQEIFDCKQINGQYTLDNIGSCLFGIETNSLKNENLPFITHIRKFFKIDIKTLFFLFLFSVPKLGQFLGKRGFSALPTDALNYITPIVNDILARRRSQLERRNDFIQIMVDHEKETENQEENKATSGQSQETGTVIKKTLSDKEIFGQALIFLVAGYETTSVLMSFFFHVMATEPAVQEKVYQEIQQELGDSEVTPENLNQLHYLDMVINETLRMYPPFIRFDRVASEDYTLDKYTIPKGGVISVPVYPIHHNPTYYPDPEKFIPERFSSSEKSKRPPMTFLPFGDGPRNCIGMRFALMEAKLAFVKALRVVEIQKCEKTEVSLRLGKLAVLSSQNPMWVRVVRRSQ